MANATDLVKKGTVRRTDEWIDRRSAAPGSSDVYYYPGAGVGVNAAGNLTKFDDTAALAFFGILRDKEGKTKIPANASAGDYNLPCQQPQRFELAVSGVAITDIGRRVFALDDQTGTLDPSATTYANVYGVVVDVVASGIALVEPTYSRPNARHPIQVVGASGAVVIKDSTVVITKAGVAALTIADPTSGAHDGVEMTFISATASAHTLSNAAGSGFNAGGAGADVGTFGGAKGDGITIIAYAGVWYVKDLRNVTLA